jgi:hypothetical protein
VRTVNNGKGNVWWYGNIGTIIFTKNMTEITELKGKHTCCTGSVSLQIYHKFIEALSVVKTVESST